MEELDGLVFTDAVVSAGSVVFSAVAGVVSFSGLFAVELSCPSVRDEGVLELSLVCDGSGDSVTLASVFSVDVCDCEVPCSVTVGSGVVEVVLVSGKGEVSDVGFSGINFCCSGDSVTSAPEVEVCEIVVFSPAVFGSGVVEELEGSKDSDGVVEVASTGLSLLPVNTSELVEVSAVGVGLVTEVSSVVKFC